MEIDVVGQRFSTEITQTNRNTIHSFIKNHLTQYDFSKKIPYAQRNAAGDQNEIKNIFAVTANETLYLHASLLKEFKKYAEIRGFKPVLNHKKPYKPKKVKYKLTEDYKGNGPLKLRDYQVPTVNSVLYNKEDGMRCFGLQPGDGKALGVLEPVLTPSGYVPIGSLKVGDYVIGSNGHPTKVTGVFPQGTKLMFSVQFIDGVKSKCCKEHLWPILKDEDAWEHMSLEDIVAARKLKPEINLAIPLASPWYGGIQEELPLDPFLLGVLLGGCDLKSNSIIIRNLTKELAGEVVRVLPNDCISAGISLDEESGTYSLKIVRLVNRKPLSIIRELKNLGLVSKHELQKMIPEEYLSSSIVNRQRLYDGVISVGGYEVECILKEYSTDSYRLSNGLSELARTLGKVMINKLPSIIENENTENSLLYRVEELPLDRKHIMDVKSIGYEEAICISVEAEDRLFVTRGNTLTHNTLSALVTAAKLEVRAVITVRASLLDQWVKEVHETYDDLEPEDVFVVKGGDAMRELLFQVANKELKAKVICISNKTYQLYMKSFLTGVDEGYVIQPTEFYSRLKVGLAIVDEFHLDFHLWMTMLSLSDANRVLVLTATLLTEDRFLKEFYNIVMPQDKRYDPMVNDPYIKYMVIQYEINDYGFRSIRYQQKFRKSYSHIELEKSILANREVSKGFDTMMVKMYDGLHVKRCKKGEKALMFTSKVEYAEHLTDVFKKQYPDLKVLTYTAGVDVSEIDNHELIIATPGKAAVGLDVSKLTTVYNTVNISAPAANVQIAGRLRMPKKNESSKLFVQLNCKNIPTHTQYQTKRDDYLGNRVKESVSIKYGKIL